MSLSPCWWYNLNEYGVPPAERKKRKAGCSSVCAQKSAYSSTALRVQSIGSSEGVWDQRTSGWKTMMLPPHWGGWWDMPQSLVCNWYCFDRKQFNAMSAKHNKATGCTFFPNGSLLLTPKVSFLTDLINCSAFTASLVNPLALCLITLVPTVLLIWGGGVAHGTEKQIRPKYKQQFHHYSPPPQRTRSLITPKDLSNVAGLVCLWGARKEKQRNWVLLPWFLPAVSFHLPSAMHEEGGGSLSSISWCCTKRYHPFIII